MSLVEVATGEIVRVGVWALRGLGMKFGVANRAAPLLAWAEAVHGGALRSLRENGEVLSATSGTPLFHRQVSRQSWDIQAPGKSLLEAGPIAMDLLTYGARSYDWARVTIHGPVDPLHLSGLCRVATVRGLAVVGLTGEAGSSGSQGIGGAIHAWPFSGGGTQFVEQYIPSGLPVSAAIENWQSEMKELRQAGQDAPPVTVFGYRPSSRLPVGHDLDGEVRLEEKFRAAQSNGVMVAVEDLANLYELEIRTWAPTSERSRKQALF